MKINPWLPEFLILIVLVVHVSCDRPDQSPAGNAPLSEVRAAILEEFSDSLRIGIPHKNKVEVVRFRILERNYVCVKFYYREAGRWYRSAPDDLLYSCDGVFHLEANVADFNSDQLNDLTFVSAEWLRGGNELRRLFIYDSAGQALRPIVNTIQYPNISFDNTHNWITSYRLHGGSETVFSRIAGDSLIDLAYVVSDAGRRKVYTIDQQGNEHLLRSDSIAKDEMSTRYLNWDPLTPEADK